MNSSSCRLAVALVVLILGAVAQGWTTAQPAPVAADLVSIFQPGLIFQDRNGDGVVDFVNARLVIGDQASSADISAAANVSARLGFETAAMNLPLDRDPARPAFVIGSDGLSRAGLSPAETGVAMLKPGEGVIAAVTLGSVPGVVIAGPDDAGTQAAADAFASRMPHMWDPRSTTLEIVAEDIRTLLENKGVEVTSLRIPRAFVTAGRENLQRLQIEVRVATARQLATARAALRALRDPSVDQTGRTVTAPRLDSDVSGNSGATTLSYPGVRLLHVQLYAPGVARVAINLVGPGDGVPPGTLGPRPLPSKDNLDLSSLFTADGLLGDSDNNLIPDRADALLSPDGPGTSGTATLAARIGLESTGITVPIARPAGMLASPEIAPPLVLIGLNHPLVQRLIADSRLQPWSLAPGEGIVCVVRRAFGLKPAVVVAGGDAAGTARALAQIGERFPHIWARGKDRTTLEDVEEDVRRFVSGRSPAGQAATALYKLDRIAADLRGKDLASARVLVSVEKAEAGLEAFVRREAQARIPAAALAVVVENRDVVNATPIFSDDVELASEVDDYWRAFRTRVLPAVRKKQAVVVEARLSESPEVRARIARDSRAALIEAGAAEDGTSVTVLSAYKQGFSWLYDVVRPALVGKAIERITIRFAEIGPPAEWPHQAMYTPTRWLLEIFPIDDVLARDLNLSLSQIRFEKMPIGSPSYEVIVTEPSGAEILRSTFEPALVLRP